MRVVLITITVIGLCVAWNCASDPPLPSETDTLKLITDGVWFRTGEREHGHCNNVVIDVGEGLLVVDANFPSGAQALMEDIKQVTTKPVSYVFDTHHHGDHAYANAVWTRAGATTLAYIGVTEEMKRYEPTRWQQAVRTREDVAALGEDSVQPPQQTFREVPHVLEGASRRVEFHHFGWAHTRGDGMVYLPDEKILCTGDAIVNGPYNYTGDGNTGNWPDVVGKALALGFETILPGHGPSGGREVAEGQTILAEGAAVLPGNQRCRREGLRGQDAAGRPRHGAGRSRCDGNRGIVGRRQQLGRRSTGGTGASAVHGTRRGQAAR